MKNSTDITTLIEQIEKCTGILHTIQSQLADMRKNVIPKLGNSIATPILFADVFVSMYTCCETAFVRISKFFENNLDSSRWHKELLDRMTLEIPAIRPRVLADETALALEEFLRFRHFKRYYFEFKYDAKRIAYLDSRFDETVESVIGELGSYTAKLRELERKVDE